MEPTPFRFTLVDGESESILMKNSDDFDGWCPMEGEIVLLEENLWYVDEVRHYPRHNSVPYSVEYICYLFEDEEEPLNLNFDRSEGYL